MTIKKIEGVGWRVNIQPGGRKGKRRQKTFKTQAEAKAYEAWLRTKVTSTPEWQPEREEKRRLKDLIDEWYEGHGATLASGTDTKKRLQALAEAIGNPWADRFTVQDFTAYRTKRLEAGITAANNNREHSYLRGMFNELKRLGRWNKPNPMGGLRHIKVPQTELSYLSREQITALLAELAKSTNPHALLVTKTALSTGGRWGETEDLRTSQLRNCQVQFARTKTDKTRSVPISKELHDELMAHHKKHAKENSVQVFGSCEGAFKEAINRAGINLPDGQMTHVLRHTFASHFMQRGGNILTLQRVLGHKDLKTTMQYAHLAPEHLQEAVRLNPLAP